jgi:hypothetical protein
MNDEFVESDLPILFSNMAKEENYLGEGGNSVAFLKDDMVLLVPHSLNPIRKKDISPSNIISALKEKIENSGESYEFRYLKDSSKYFESMPIAVWGSPTQGLNIQIMNYLGENHATENNRTPEAAVNSMNAVFEIITSPSKIKEAIDSMRELDLAGYELDPKPDNLTILNGNVKFIDLNRGSSGVKLDYLIDMLVPYYIFVHHPKKDYLSDSIKDFINMVYEYGQSVGLKPFHSIEHRLEQYGVATDQEVQRLNDQKKEELSKIEEDRKKHEDKIKNSRSEESKAIAFSIFYKDRELSKYFEDITFLKNKIPDDLFLIIEEVKSGNSKYLRKLVRYLMSNQNFIDKINDLAKSNYENNKEAGSKLDSLILLADYFDERGLSKKANFIDALIAFASDDDSEEDSEEDVGNPLYQDYNYGQFEYAKDEDLLDNVEGPEEILNFFGGYLSQYKNANDKVKRVMIKKEVIYGISESGRLVKEFLDNFIETEGSAKFDFSMIQNISYYVPVYIHAIMIGAVDMEDVIEIRNTLNEIHLEVIDPDYARRNKEIDETPFDFVDYNEQIEEDFPIIKNDIGEGVDLGSLQNIDFYEQEEMGFVDENDPKLHRDFFRKQEYSAPKYDGDDFDDEFV